MDVRFSDEQVALRDSVAHVVDRLAPKTVAEIGDAERTKQLDAAVNESGWRELRTPVGEGSPLATGVEVALVAQELGRGVADTPFVGPTLALELRRLAGLSGSDGIETVAFGPRLSSVVRDTERGLSTVAIDAVGASSALALVPESDGYRLAQVLVGSPLRGPDLTRPAAVIEATTHVAVVEGTERRISRDDLDRWTALGLVLASADLVGIMRGALRLATDYATERRQFGVPIGTFQAVQHLLADGYVAMEGSSSITLHAAWAVDALATNEALEAALVAKAYCARAARTVCETAIQVHGGIGNTWECLAHVFLRRALVSIDLLGDEQVSLARLVERRAMGSSHGLR